MSDVAVVKLDILDIGEPALSSTSDIPIIETKPDSQPETKPAPKEEAKAKDLEDAAVDETKKAEESATPETPEDSSASDEPKKAKGVQKRIDELTSNWREAERREEAARQENLRLLALVERGGKVEDKPAAKEDQEPQKPTRESFGTTDEYVAALADYADAKASWSSEKAVKEVLAAEALKTEQRQIEAGQKAAQEAYAKRVEAATKEYPDYKEVAESPDVAVSIPMAHAILQSEQGPKIAYYLGKHPEEAARISQLPPPVQLMEMGSIVASFSAPAASPAPQPKPVVSAAPKPLKPLESKSEPVAKNPQDMNMDEYAEMVRQRDKKARAGART